MKRTKIQTVVETPIVINNYSLNQGTFKSSLAKEITNDVETFMLNNGLKGCVTCLTSCLTKALDELSSGANWAICSHYNEVDSNIKVVYYKLEYIVAPAPYPCDEKDPEDLPF